MKKPSTTGVGGHLGRSVSDPYRTTDKGKTRRTPDDFFVGPTFLCPGCPDVSEPVTE